MNFMNRMLKKKKSVFSFYFEILLYIADRSLILSCALLTTKKIKKH